jgi:hypothetical protein
MGDHGQTSAKDRKHLIKTKLMTEALPLARRWLMKNGDHDEIGILGITFSFDEESEDLKVNESSSFVASASLMVRDTG